MNLTQTMDAVHSRITQIEPDNASKIFAYLAFGPDSVIHSIINLVKHEFAKNAHYEMIETEMESLENMFKLLDFEESMTNNHESSSNSFFSRSSSFRTSRRTPSLPEMKTCHYFNKGYCKHGNNCRYFHGEIIPERDVFNPRDREHVVSPASLEKLEGELIELLKSRRGVPISIASLPMMYYEKYGRTLQAEGYLTESQRHGKAGYSLTKLLARLSNTIRLIDRPHGQHSVILAEDASLYLEYTGDRNEHGTILSNSRQIYLTFPAESSFTDEDVSNYFSTFGHVEDVRFPYQQKRMYGFVTFAYIETVQQVLAQGNPHFICGARVLVKPYREKLRSNHQYFGNNKPYHSFRYGSQYSGDLELNTVQQQVRESSRLMMMRPFMNERDRTVSKSLPTNYSFPGFSSHDFNLTSNEENEEQAERIRYLLDYLNTEDNETDRQDLNLPESPFSFPLSERDFDDNIAKEEEKQK